MNTKLMLVHSEDRDVVPVCYEKYGIEEVPYESMCTTFTGIYVKGEDDIYYQEDYYTKRF